MTYYLRLIMLITHQIMSVKMSLWFHISQTFLDKVATSV
jgi:hypothetical protein